MLTSLDIRDMLIIDRLELAFQPGLNVLTGETGAGKSILLDSLRLVLGWRGRAELVRQGAEQGEVTAVFEIEQDHPANAVLEAAGLSKSNELILRRVNLADGRKTAWVNDRRVSGDVLRQLSDTLVELHGQHDDRGLLNPRGHRDLLDAFAGTAGLIDKTRKAWRAQSEAQAALDAAEADLIELKAEEDFLRHAVGEFDGLNPEPGEEDTLDTRRRLMQAAARVGEDLARAAQALGLDGAEGAISDAARWLEGADGALEGALTTALDALGRTTAELGEAQDGLSRVIDALDVDPTELEQVEERLFAIRALARKHGVAADDLAAFADTLRTRLSVLDRSDAHLIDLTSVRDAARAAYAKAAAALTKARTKSAAALDKAMMAELKPLKMERAVFETAVTPTDPGPSGQDAVAFTVATNPGAPKGALNKIASGGELSRFLLALKVCLTGTSSGLTLIFDEIDRGVGGATADAVGRRLSSLADGAQVLVVTHSPQVAALGAHHWQVAKRVEKGMTLSDVAPLHDTARVDEIARMLSGDTVTDAARAAARALLEAS